MARHHLLLSGLGMASVAVALALLTRPPPPPPAPEIAAARALIPVLEHPQTPPSTDQLAETFRLLDYDLGDLPDSGEVPAIYIAGLPADMRGIDEPDERKALFFRLMLPLVLKANDEVLDERRRLLDLQAVQASGQPLGAEDQRWLEDLAARYEATSGEIDELLLRVDVVPPSLALAQSAEESGWGTSRFSHQAKALFGQWAPDGFRANDGSDVRVAAFPTLLDSVRSYISNLNTHPAYHGFRRARAAARAEGRIPHGDVLAGTLLRYSERGQDYVDTLRRIIRGNRLTTYDDLRLGPRLVEEGDAPSP